MHLLPRLTRHNKQKPYSKELNVYIAFGLISSRSIQILTIIVVYRHCFSGLIADIYPLQSSIDFCLLWSTASSQPSSFSFYIFALFFLIEFLLAMQSRTALHQSFLFEIRLLTLTHIYTTPSMIFSTIFSYGRFTSFCPVSFLSPIILFELEWYTTKKVKKTNTQNRNNSENIQQIDNNQYRWPLYCSLRRMMIFWLEWLCLSIYILTLTRSHRMYGVYIYI